MTEERSPWSRPETETVVAAGAAASPGAAAPSGARAPAGEPAAAGRPYRSGAVTRLAPPGSGSLPGSGSPPGGAGAASGLGATDVISGGPAEPEDDPALRERRTMRWFIAAAAGVVAVGVVVVLALVMTGRASGGDGLLSRPLAGPGDTRPELAKRCPPPSEAPARPQEVPPTPPGPRTVDTDAGISYAAYPAPWQPWDQVWSGGTLHVTYRVGQHFITEPGPTGEGYHASILSGSVPATVNDAMVLDLECTGQQVAADVRAEYYYQPNTMDPMRDERATIGGLPAWVTTFRLHFDHQGLRAKDELVAVVLLDVGRPEAAILYVSIPGTNHEWDHILDEVIDSVRPT